MINTVTSIILSSILRYLYKGYDLIGSIIIGLAVKVPKEKVPLPPIGDRTILREPVGTISEKVSSAMQQGSAGHFGFDILAFWGYETITLAA